MSAHHPITLVHHCEHPFVLDRQRTYKQTPDRKPRGLFLSTQTQDGWEEWCLGESYCLPGLAHCTEVQVDPARLLVIQSEEQLRQFDHQYGGGPIDCGVLRGNSQINWPAVAETYQGIVIVPHQWNCRYEPSWYYTWDCATACIWDLAAIMEVRHKENYSPPPLPNDYTEKVEPFHLKGFF